jgi:translation initiation factor eIF-2B subunit alpha
MDANEPADPAGPKFDIVSTYNSLLRSDPDLSMPVAAIESLVRALAAHPTTTVAETLEYLKTQSTQLIQATPNPISLSAGTSLLQRYLAVLNTTDAGAGADADNFEAVRNHLLQSGRLIIERAKAARATIASFHRQLVRPGKTLLTMGGSRVVDAVLCEAAEAARGGVRFRVIYVLAVPPPRQPRDDSAAAGSADAAGPVPPLEQPEGWEVVQALRAKGVPVATIGEGAVGYALRMVDLVVVGAEAIVKNGGAISRLGTYQMAILAKHLKKPFYVVAEKHKLSRVFPLHQYDLPITQNVIEFQVNDDHVVEPGPNATVVGKGDMMEVHVKPTSQLPNWPRDAVDYTVCYTPRACFTCHPPYCRLIWSIVS